MRAVTAAVEAALAAGTARPVIAIEIQHDSGYLRMSTFNRDIDWNGATFLGNSYILSVQAQTETSDLANSGMTVEVKGGSDVRSLVLGGMTGRLTARAYLMLLDSNEDLLDDPIVMFSGYYDFATIDYAPDQCVVTFNFEDEMSDFKRAGTIAGRRNRRNCSTSPIPDFVMCRACKIGPRCGAGRSLRSRKTGEEEASEMRSSSKPSPIPPPRRVKVVGSQRRVTGTNKKNPKSGRIKASSGARRFRCGSRMRAASSYMAGRESAERLPSSTPAAATRRPPCSRPATAIHR